MKLKKTPTVCKSKSAKKVFAKWIDQQKIFEDQPISNILQKIDIKVKKRFTKKWDTYQETLKTTTPFLQTLLAGEISLSQQAQNNLLEFYQALDHDNQKVLSYLQQAHFINERINTQEEKSGVNKTIRKYQKLLSLLLCQTNKKKLDELMFSIANRFFEFCFDQKTFPNFNKVLIDSSQHQIARFFYAIMWRNLAGDGWKHWHRECLNGLVLDAKNNKEIVYIAGGNDIYQLLKNNIYNIRVIDPMLPSQPDYYAEGWKWLIKGLIGDRLLLDIPEKKIIMQRTNYQEHDTFRAKLSTGKRVSLMQSTTEWAVYEQDSDKKIGTIIFERRFCDQKDFIKNPKKSILLSFNEMYFVAMPQDMGGWGIDVKKFAPDIFLHVKQLRKPVCRDTLKNIIRAEKSSLNFIQLGSCIT